MRLSRRQFLGRTGAASAGLLVPRALELLAARMAAAAPATVMAQGYGPLRPDPAGLLDLPEGFHSRALSTAVIGTTADARFSQKLSNGEWVPAMHDGMAAFRAPAGAPAGSTVLVRNHELQPGDSPAVDPEARRRYDALGTGGTTTLWVDRDRNLIRAFPSLSGTFRNCGGGPTPWGSWLTAEECVYLPGPLDARVHDRRPDVRERHGYVFEVDARAAGLVEPLPIRAMGRFYHEAVAVDPATAFVYLTEDRGDGLLYRYRPEMVTSGRKLPNQLGVGDLARGGTLEALRIVDRPGARTQNWEAPDFAVGEEFAVDWVAIAEVDPDMDMERDPEDDHDPLEHRPRTAATSLRAQGFALGAAQFARHEGITFHGRSVYVCATNGGLERAGQVWRLDLARQRLSLLHEPNDRALLEGPDNIVVAPNGDLIVCEDGRNDDSVVGITPEGRFYRLARNAADETEFAGACFSPDGRTLFVNVQDPGITYAIWGPWSARKS